MQGLRKWPDEILPRWGCEQRPADKGLRGFRRCRESSVQQSKQGRWEVGGRTESSTRGVNELRTKRRPGKGGGRTSELPHAPNVVAGREAGGGVHGKRKN